MLLLYHLLQSHLLGNKLLYSKFKMKAKSQGIFQVTIVMTLLEY